LAFLDCKDINKRFGAVVALKDAAFSFNSGEIHAILGGNGSGKSTLARIVGGSVSADSGEVIIDGKQVHIDSPVKAKKLGIAVTSQELSLFNHMTVEDNLSLLDDPAYLHLLRSPRQASKKTLDVLEQLGLQDILKRRVSELTENKKYLIEFAKAIQYEPKILFLDEITSALYREEVEMVKGHLFKMANAGCAIVFISHRLQEIYSISAKVTVMRNGQVVNTHDITDSEDTLIREMIGEDVRSAGINQAKVDKTAILPGGGPNLITLTNFNIPGFKKRFDFEIKKGEMIGIAGLQGQGQSPFMRTLFGINKPVILLFEGKEVRMENPRQAIKLGFAYLSGDRKKEGVYYGRSIFENITDVSMQVLQDKVFDEDALMKKFGVKYKSKYQAIETLSGGNQQKVVTARWVGVKPLLLMADDPTKGIDVVARGDVHRIFSNLVEEGSTVIMSSSDDDELVKLADVVRNYKVLVMYNGKVVKVLTGKDITISNIITNSMPRGKI
jgi:ABC-type sugar transport system ATPase subunit